MELFDQEIEFESLVSDAEITHNLEEVKMLSERGLKLKIKNPDELEAA